MIFAYFSSMLGQATTGDTDAQTVFSDSLLRVEFAWNFERIRLDSRRGRFVPRFRSVSRLSENGSRHPYGWTFAPESPCTRSQRPTCGRRDPHLRQQHLGHRFLRALPACAFRSSQRRADFRAGAPHPDLLAPGLHGIRSLLHPHAASQPDAVANGGSVKVAHSFRMKMKLPPSSLAC